MVGCQMIFVTLGSQKFQFNRLLEEIDRLIKTGRIAEAVFAQTGYSTYQPKYFLFKDFLDREEYKNCIEKSSFVITHGGTGAIIGSLKKGKKVIAIPRRVEFEEHVDNHQLQLLSQFDELKLVSACYELSDLKDHIKVINNKEFASYHSNTEKIIASIDQFLSSI